MLVALFLSDLTMIHVVAVGVQGNCNITSAERCSGGRAGILCSGCATAGFVAWGTACIECTSIGWVPVIILVGTLCLHTACSLFGDLLVSNRLRYGLLAVFVFAVVCVFLFNNYNDMQSKFKQYIDYNQLFNVVVQSTSSHTTYFIQKVLLLLAVMMAAFVSRLVSFTAVNFLLLAVSKTSRFLWYFLGLRRRVSSACCPSTSPQPARCFRCPAWHPSQASTSFWLSSTRCQAALLQRCWSVLW